MVNSIQFAFQYWNGGVSALYEGQDAIDFVAQHYSPDNGTYASICFGNNPLIADAYVSLDGGSVFCEGTGIGDVVTYYGEGVEEVSFDAFI